MPQNDYFKPTRLLTYVVSSDTGLAPNPSTNVCTLAVCKPEVRKSAVIGQDWIIGVSTADHGRNRVICVMSVDEKIPYADYFNDARFAAKKPDTDSRGDNFFRWGKAGYEVAFRTAAHYGNPVLIARDVKAPWAVVGHRFWYFGENAPELPKSFHHTNIVLPDRSRRGHRVIDDAALIERFVAWAERQPQGIHGRPRDAVKTTPTTLHKA